MFYCNETHLHPYSASRKTKIVISAYATILAHKKSFVTPATRRHNKT